MPHSILERAARLHSQLAHIHIYAKKKQKKIYTEKIGIKKLVAAFFLLLSFVRMKTRTSPTSFYCVMIVQCSLVSDRMCSAHPIAEAMRMHIISRRGMSSPLVLCIAEPTTVPRSLTHTRTHALTRSFAIL